VVSLGIESRVKGAMRRALPALAFGLLVATPPLASADRVAPPAEASLIRAAVNDYLPNDPAYNPSAGYIIYPTCISTADSHYAAVTVWPVGKYGLRGAQPFSEYLFFSKGYLEPAPFWNVIPAKYAPPAVIRDNSKQCIPTETATQHALDDGMATIEHFRSLVYVPNVSPGGGTPVYKPLSLDFSVDSGQIYGIKRWVTYGRSAARALAVWGSNNCTPSCANGHITSVTFQLTLSGARACDGRTAYGTLIVSQSSDAALLPNRSMSLAGFCKGAPVAPPVPKPAAVTNVATISALVHSLLSSGVHFGGATHPVKGALCSGLGKSYPDPFGTQDAAYSFFKCQTVIRYFENGGYNDKQETIWERVIPNHSFFPEFEFRFTPYPSLDPALP
jgi:hypothetical protein